MKDTTSPAPTSDSALSDLISAHLRRALAQETAHVTALRTPPDDFPGTLAMYVAMRLTGLQMLSEASRVLRNGDPQAAINLVAAAGEIGL